ncbi:very short patch repair endonuclease [Archangium gephyra]|uniref:very short patch repair endonuclease n=1 Tax=Archangium gephyra TaxID=48 RepID=UPI003B810BE6
MSMRTSRTAPKRRRRLKPHGHRLLTKSEQMARVRSRDTDAEVLLRRALWRAGLRFRLGTRALPGSPDIIFKSKRIAVFVNGCFWHGCPVHYTEPKANREFWLSKLETNRRRDQRVDGELLKLGWRVIRIWEHEVYGNIADVVARVQKEHGAGLL